MKKIIFIALLVVVLLGTVCVCDANMIIPGLERLPRVDSPADHRLPSTRDYPVLVLCFAGVVFVESVILLGFLRDFRVLWACPYANAVSTIPGFFLLGTLGLDESTSPIAVVCIIIGCFLVSALIESSLIVAVIRKLPLGQTFLSTLAANAMTYFLIIASMPLGFVHLSL
jgi:hypothetical protein